MIHIRAKHLKNVQVCIGSQVKGSYSVIVAFPGQDYRAQTSNVLYPYSTQATNRHELIFFLIRGGGGDS